MSAQPDLTGQRAAGNQPVSGLSLDLEKVNTNNATAPELKASAASGKHTAGAADTNDDEFRRSKQRTDNAGSAGGGGGGGSTTTREWQPPLRAKQMLHNDTQEKRETFLSELKYLDIGVSIKGLQSTDIMSFIDPCVVAWVPDEKGTGWREYMRTEVMFDSPEPRFATWITIKLDPYREQLVKLVLYDWEDSRKTTVLDQEPIAQVIIDAADVALAGTTMRFRKPLQPPNKIRPIDFKRSPFIDHGLGVITLVGVPSEMDSHKSRWVRLHLGTKRLLRENVHGRDKFWIEVSRWSEGEFDIVYRSEEAGNMDNMYRSFALSLPRVCYNQLEADIRFDVMHRTAVGVISKPRLIGQTVISLKDLLEKFDGNAEVEESLARSQSDGRIVFKMARIYAPSHKAEVANAEQALKELKARQLVHPTTGATMPPTPQMCALASSTLRERETVVPPLLLNMMTKAKKSPSRPFSSSGAMTARGRLEAASQAKPSSAPGGPRPAAAAKGAAAARQGSVSGLIQNYQRQTGRPSTSSSSSRGHALYSSSRPGSVTSRSGMASPRVPMSARDRSMRSPRPHTPRISDLAKGSLPENNPMSKDCAYLQDFLQTRDGVQTPHLVNVVSECLWFIQESRVASMEDWNSLKKDERMRRKNNNSQSLELRGEFTNFHKQLKLTLKETSRDARKLGTTWTNWTRPEPVCKPPPPPSKQLSKKTPKRDVLREGYNFKKPETDLQNAGSASKTEPMPRTEMVSSALSQALHPKLNEKAAREYERTHGGISGRNSGKLWAYALNKTKPKRPCDQSWIGIAKSLMGSGSGPPGARPKAENRKRVHKALVDEVELD
ncbi:hypothetical protein RI054_41g148950 [Pseudoscourfieldia marina]